MEQETVNSSVGNILVQMNDIGKSYGQTEVLKNINLNIFEGQNHVIQGASGSGKSTLLYILGSLERPTSGQVFLAGKETTKMNDAQLSEMRNRFIGFVFQFHFLLPSMTCMQNILLPAKIAGIKEKKIKAKILEYAEELNITHCLKKYPFEISGGEQQRVNIIRAISLSPKLILCDEPTGNLDSKNTQVAIAMLKNLAKEAGSTLIVVTHDNSVAASFEHKITIEDGQIIG
ncbi:MAG: lipoprotein-releasing system ATP-binding protein LolD [Halobacteriovoraceae bacterium]|nr:lipoprotein-releasing system ATP-binding protein LolD [Halobacteriovoraceae bacterium]|tara:strand:+ start:12024 stop:12716 length:693 start_codon:yes stop_codon:yes gene_type:complete